MKKKQLLVHFGEAKGIQKNWGWFFVLGLLLVLLGLAVVGSAYTATIFSVVLFGFLLVGAGCVQVAHAIMAREWGGFFIALLLAILSFVAGVLCIGHPTLAALDLTLLIGTFCFIGGLFKMIASLMMRFYAWKWVFFNGLVTFILGVLIYTQWPVSGLWLIGTFVGVDMLLVGWSWIILALQAKK